MRAPTWRRPSDPEVPDIQPVYDALALSGPRGRRCDTPPPPARRPTCVPEPAWARDVLPRQPACLPPRCRSSSCTMRMPGTGSAIADVTRQTPQPPAEAGSSISSHAPPRTLSDLPAGLIPSIVTQPSARPVPPPWCATTRTSWPARRPHPLAVQAVGDGQGSQTSWSSSSQVSRLGPAPPAALRPAPRLSPLAAARRSARSALSDSALSGYAPSGYAPSGYPPPESKQSDSTPSRIRPSGAQSPSRLPSGMQAAEGEEDHEDAAAADRGVRQVEDREVRQLDEVDDPAAEQRRAARAIRSVRLPSAPPSSRPSAIAQGAL